MRTHQEKGIGKVMWFSTQFKRHRVTGCDVLDLPVEMFKGDSKTPLTLPYCDMIETFIFVA